MATYYVAKTGHDANPGTQLSPKLTINAGIGLASGAGDVVTVADGVYAETISNWPSGTSGNPFILRSTNALGAILRPSGSSNILSFGGSYITVERFVVDGVNTDANNIVLNPNTTDVTIQNCEIKNIRVGGGNGPDSFQAIYSNQSNNGRILNNTIHDVGNGATYHFNHAIYWGSSNGLIQGNTIYNIGAFGIQVYSASATNLNNNTIRENRVYNFCRSATGTATGIYLSSGSNNVAFNNLVYHSTSNPNAVGITLTASSNRAFNNTIYNNGYMGLEVGGTNSVAKNNIAFQNGVNIELVGSGYSVDHNLTSNPFFADASNGDFHLTAASTNAIDQGVVIN